MALATICTLSFGADEKDNVIEIESIDAFPDTPVLDIKS
jgi:tRNA (Thr-GGU) A37 N-methylase